VFSIGADTIVKRDAVKWLRMLGKTATAVRDNATTLQMGVMRPYLMALDINASDRRTKAKAVDAVV